MPSRAFFIVLALLFVAVGSYLFFHSNSKETPAWTVQKSKALASLEFWNDQRAYPTNSIPDAGFFSAFQYSKSNLSNTFDSLLVQPWQTLGPHNIGGRTLALALNPQNPQTLYAGSASGGLWRSYSGGVGAQAWEYVSTGFPVLGVSAIAIAEHDSNVIYIGTGEVYNYQNAGTGFTLRPTRGSYGIGILKTTDGGMTWTPSLDWTANQKRGVWAVRINPLNPNTVWAATTEGVYKSLDAGTSWHLQNSTKMIMDLVLHTQDTNTVYIAAGNLRSSGRGIYRTQDGGQTWEPLIQGLPDDFGGKVQLATCASAGNILYASFGNSTSSRDSFTRLCRTEDGGDTWQIVNSTDYSLWQGWFSHDVAVHPQQAHVLMAVGISVWKSTSAGEILNEKGGGGIPYGRPPVGGPEGPANYVHADIHDVIYDPSNPNVIYFATDGGIFRSTDGGETFEGCNGGYQTTQFYQGVASSRQDSLLLIGGMQDNGSAIFDGQLAWQRVWGGDGAFTAIHSKNDRIIYTSSQRLNIVKSFDRGANWNRLTKVPDTGGTAFIAPFILAETDPEVIYAGRSVVYKSTNGGLSWQSTNSGPPLDRNPLLAFAISHQNDDVVYASTAPVYFRAGVYRTTNSGATWENITGNLPDRYPVDLAVDANDDATVYVVFSGFGTSHLFMSPDAGESWQDIGAGLPDVPTSAIVVDPEFPDHLYVGNDLGVYVTTNGGRNWLEYSTGLPDAVIVMDLIISPVNRKLRVATHGNGFFERPLIQGNLTEVVKHPISVGEFKLAANYPNPFNPSTTIEYVLPGPALVRLEIFNLKGERVTTLIHSQQSAGSHRVDWDGTTDRGLAVSSGVYLYRLSTRAFTTSRKMMLIR
ncbi:MAG: FlgD immunoglobulin-like domain containing protein [bacterium]